MKTVHVLSVALCSYNAIILRASSPQAAVYKPHLAYTYQKGTAAEL